ncbi:chromate transporter [Deinococcus sonorensis]|uniref:Chromate transporter n=2 Tax=Deinococcus sonorensis TaxID=309891 RepID=A0AAU7UBJ7_9DEIO
MTTLQVLVAFLQLGLLSFGSVNLASMERLVVQQHHWISQAQFVQGYALGQLLPGPNVLAILLYGYGADGFPGALAALVGFFVPPAAVVLAVYRLTQRGTGWLQRAYRALLPVGAGLLLAGLLTLARGSVTTWGTAGIAVVAFGLVMTRRVPPVWVVVGGVAAGLLLARPPA